MNKWKEEELHEIRRVFNWADMDGDEYLSREDLHVAMGIGDGSVVENLFFRLKGCKNAQEPFVSFEEFSENITEVLEVIQKFKEECLDKPLNERKSYSEFRCEHDNIDYRGSLEQEDPLDFLKQPLSMTMSLLLPLIGTSFPEDEGVEGMLVNLETSISKLSSQETQARIDTNSIRPLIHLCNNMVSIIRHLYEFQETARLSLKNDLREANNAYDSITEKCSQLEHRNSKLLKRFEQLERDHQASEIQINNAVSQKIELQRNMEQLKKEKKVELYARQRDIEKREKELVEMKKELRDQQSKQHIQQMRDVSGLISDEKIKEIKIKKFNSRMTIEGNERRQNKKDPEYKVKILTGQIHSKDSTISRLNRDIEELNSENKALLTSLQKVKQENNELSLKNEEIKAYINMNMVDDRISVRSGTANFLDEVNQLGISEYNTFTKEIMNENELSPFIRFEPLMSIAKQLSVNIEAALTYEVQKHMGATSNVELSIGPTIKEVVDKQFGTQRSINAEVIKQVGVSIQAALKDKLNKKIDRQLESNLQIIVNQQVSAEVHKQIGVGIQQTFFPELVKVYDSESESDHTRPQKQVELLEKSVECKLLDDCKLEHLPLQDVPRDSCNCSIF